MTANEIRAAFERAIAESLEAREVSNKLARSILAQASELSDDSWHTFAEALARA